MSVSFGCRCPESKKPVRERAWVVVQRLSHCSAFAGYHQTPSRYSTVFCKCCRALGRTKASYVRELPDGRIE